MLNVGNNNCTEGHYQINITLTNSEGAQSNYSITLKVLNKESDLIN